MLLFFSLIAFLCGYLNLLNLFLFIISLFVKKSEEEKDEILRDMIKHKT
jgi:hypothetical protein